MGAHLEVIGEGWNCKLRCRKEIKFLKKIIFGYDEMRKWAPRFATRAQRRKATERQKDKRREYFDSIDPGWLGLRSRIYKMS